ncbi:hypothetical protein [Burkholderia ubonensis]|uniref:hypothetical protein n=1 Tax=Burkholderia ubonensis TaxID=101571 RepID=UPI000A5EA838|nr:hypothetical protein [Burkholderia ubonensis]
MKQRLIEEIEIRIRLFLNIRKADRNSDAFKTASRYGYEASERGLSHEDCPYSRGSPSFYGWIAGMEEVIKDNLHLW